MKTNNYCQVTDELGVDFSLCGVSDKESDELGPVYSRRLLSYYGLQKMEAMDSHF